MRFPQPLRRGTLVRRYKRFFVDVTLDDGTEVTAHCANSGSMRSVCPAGAPVWLSPATTPGRKLAWTWELVQVGEALVGVNTNTPNRLVAEAVAAGEVPELGGYTRMRREVPYAGRSRIDLLLDDGGQSTPAAPACYVEIKSVTLKDDPAPEGLAAFPDAVTARGTRHLEDLAAMAAGGHRAVLLFLVQRSDGGGVTLAAEIDPAYARAFDAARAAGVEVLCLGCALDPESGIRINRRLPLVWGGSPP